MLRSSGWGRSLQCSGSFAMPGKVMVVSRTASWSMYGLVLRRREHDYRSSAGYWAMYDSK